MNISSILDKSILLVAHPDDEILWFSSLLSKVDEVIFCYLESKIDPRWTDGRNQVLSEYPLNNISCLNMTESVKCDSADWQKPVTDRFGIQITKKKISDRYKENYDMMERSLQDKLKDCKNLITHNPWGEYGNEDHVQIYRIAKKYQKEFKFNLWFSNCCSNKSYPLMLKYISEFHSSYITFETDKDLAHKIKKLYEKTGCWTWHNDWTWFNEESFMRDMDIKDTNKVYGHIFPINLMKIELPRRGFARVSHKLKKICNLQSDK